MSKFYTSSNYQADHGKLARNLMDYFFSGDEVSIQIVLDSERTSNAQFNTTLYIKDVNTGMPIDSSVLNTNLSVLIANSSFSESITFSSTEDGIAQNNTYSLSSTNYEPYKILVNFTYNFQTYQKTSKLLFFNPTSVPIINSLTVSNSPINRTPGNTTQIQVDLDSSSYDVDAYLSLYSYSFYNTKQTINKTFPLSYSATKYRYTYDPSISDPAAIAIYYIVPENSASNYTNPYSPRFPFEIRNNDPTFIESNSYITIADQNTFAFDETYEGESSYLIPVSQGDELDFVVSSIDSVNYEDVDSSNMRVSVNLFMVSTTDDGYINIIYPRALPLTELIYQPATDSHEGTFIVPFTIAYNSITGIKEVSTATNYNTETEEGYLAILLITIFDSEGGSEDFVMILSIRATIQFDLVLLLIIIGLVVAIGIIVFIAFIAKSKKSKASAERTEYYPQDYYTTPTEDTAYESTSEDSDGYRTGFYCPYCGYNIGSPKSFCPNCGKSLYFES
jgi:hypothetical protein